MRFIVIGIVFYCIFIIHSCVPEDPTEKYKQIKRHFYLNRNIYFTIANKANSEKYPINYLGNGTIELAKNITDAQIIWYQNKLNELSNSIVLQMNEKPETVRFGIWSQGIVTAGSSVTIFYTKKPIYERVSFKRRNSRGEMSCETLEKEWYICLSN